MRIRSFFKLGENWIVTTITGKVARIYREVATITPKVTTIALKVATNHHTSIFNQTKKTLFTHWRKGFFEYYAKSSSTEMYGSPCASATA